MHQGEDSASIIASDEAVTNQIEKTLTWEKEVNFRI